MEKRFKESKYSGGIKEMRSTDYCDIAKERDTNIIVTYRNKYLMLSTSNPQPIGFRGILLVKRQKFILLYIFLA